MDLRILEGQPGRVEEPGEIIRGQLESVFVAEDDPDHLIIQSLLSTFGDNIAILRTVFAPSSESCRFLRDL